MVPGDPISAIASDPASGACIRTTKLVGNGCHAPANATEFNCIFLQRILRHAPSPEQPQPKTQLPSEEN
jgi:hypothetical protein